MVSHTILRCASVFREKSHKQNSPVRVASGDTEAEGGGEVKPETLPELSSDRCDGHGVRSNCSTRSCQLSERWLVGSGQEKGTLCWLFERLGQCVGRSDMFAESFGSIEASARLRLDDLGWWCARI